MGPELFNVDGQTRPADMTKLIVTYRSFVNASKKRWLYASVGSIVCMCAVVNTFPVNMQKVPAL
jgi:hypothetical protein